MNYRSETLKKLKESMKEKKKYIVKVLGKEFVVYPGVFSPKYFSDTEFFAGYLPVKKGNRLLEIGCGTGIVAIFALIRGASGAVCVDINPAACKNTQDNARLHHLEKKLKVLKGDVFSPLRNEKFDVIFWNIPFGYSRGKLSMMERSVFDSQYKSAEKFFHNVAKYRKPKGHVYVGFSTDIGDFEKLEEIALTSDYTLKMIKNVISTQSKSGILPPAAYQIFELVESPFGVF